MDSLYPKPQSAPLARPDRRQWLQRQLLIWERPVWSALLAIVVYALIAADHGSLWQPSKYAYFNYLADAFLHGRLDLRVTPASVHDLSLFNGRYYLYWPPFPALVLLPFVALFGVGTSDILVTIALGGLNVALIAILLRRANDAGVIQLSALQRGLLVLCFALGSTHTALAPYGRVWYTGQLVGFACVVLAYLAALSLKRTAAFVCAGIALGCALLTRNHLVLAGLWPACYLLWRHWQVLNVRGWRLAGYMLAGITPIVVALALLGGYNWLRFGDLLDNGLAYHQMSAFFARDYRRYGAFNLYYLPTNVWYEFIAYPLPWRQGSDLGGSLFLLTPVFFAALWGLIQGRPRWSTWALLATMLLVAVPILLLMGTGWRQFGPRYTLDFTVPLLLLTAIGIRRWPLWLVGVLVTISVLHYLIGALYLGTVIGG
ncbi:MAG TPA: hypothetical protein VGD58_03300 [Herpetosiphonaceae bacterium]